MPRTANSYDIFTAIAEPKRRELIDKLLGDELSVNQLVEKTSWNQPMVSKHLSVLKSAGLVSERRVGRQRLYRVNPGELQPVQIWVRQFEKYWNKQFDQLDEYLADIQQRESKE